MMFPAVIATLGLADFSLLPCCVCGFAGETPEAAGVAGIVWEYTWSWGFVTSR